MGTLAAAGNRIEHSLDLSPNTPSYAHPSAEPFFRGIREER
jgi:hypothetical protein